MNNRTNVRLARVGVAMLAAAIAVTSFAIVRTTHEGDAAQAQPPPDPNVAPNATPIAGATPDTKQPGWYIPYLNADREKPQFVGKLAGIDVRPFDASVPAEDAGGCPAGTTELHERFDDGVNSEPLGIRLGAMATGISRSGTPKALVCDGQLVAVEQYFDVLSADGSGVITGSLKVFRSSVGHRFWLPAAGDRWTAERIAGRPAATLKPVIVTVGTSAVIVNDGRGYTALVGEGVTLEFLKRAAEEIER